MSGENNFKDLWAMLGIVGVSLVSLYANVQKRLRIERAEEASACALKQGLLAKPDELIRGYLSNPNMGYLSATQVMYAVQLVKALHPLEELQFSCVDALEPTKEELAKAVRGGSPRVPVRARVISMHIPSNSTYVDVVSLEEEHKVGFSLSSSAFDDVQVSMSPNEYENCERLVRSYPPLRAALMSRGLNPDYLKSDTWCCGYCGPEDDPSERLGWALLCYSDPTKGGNDLPYARPIEGIHLRLSITRMCVISFDDSEFWRFKIPDARPEHNFIIPAAQQRTDLNPISITQPQGATFVVNDTSVNWLEWDFQVGFSDREGLTLHGLCFQGRPVLHKVSLAEMVVPYGDPRKPHALKNAFDAGEDGMGCNANSLVLGCDCLGEIHYFDGNLVDDAGNLVVIKNAICMHEEDYGTAWKHTDWRTGHAEVRRGRRLVISCVSTIANYEYGFYWYLDLTGSIELDVKLTGTLSTGVLASDERDGRKYGTVLDKSLGLFAPVHQHFFCARLDPAVDGAANTAVEMNVSVDQEQSPRNPYANAFWYESTPLVTELQAERQCNSEGGRFWKVVSNSRVNKTGCKTAYKLIPTASVKPFSDLRVARMLRRAQFMRSSLWVTAFDQEQRYPAGDFPNQANVLDGLPLWIQRDAPLLDEDVVLWYVFGVTHEPRLEDWPVMPVEHTGFHFKPCGFLDMNPTMTLPAGRKGFGSGSGLPDDCCKLK